MELIQLISYSTEANGLHTTTYSQVQVSAAMPNLPISLKNTTKTNLVDGTTSNLTEFDITTSPGSLDAKGGEFIENKLLFTSGTASLRRR